MSVRFSEAVSGRAPCARATSSNCFAVSAARFSGRIVTARGFAVPRSVREIPRDPGGVVFLEVAQGMMKELSIR